MEVSGTQGGIIINSATSNISRLIFTNNNTDGSEGVIRYDGSNQSMQFWTNVNERMRIDSGGNLLIGTTTSSPFGKIHLENGKLYVYGGAVGNTSGDSIEHANIRGARHHLVFKEIRTANTSDWNSTTFRLQARVDSTNHQSINFVSDGSYAEHVEIRTGNDVFHSRFTHNGLLGIGTTSPSEKLEVAGNIILDASSARLKLKGGTSGTNSGIDWTFNTESTQYARIDLDYNSRSSVGLLIDSGYPITMDYSASYWRVRQNGTEQMRLTTGADLHVDGDVVAYSTTISDKRLKDNVQTIDNALETIEKLRGVSYVWNNGKRKNQKDIGLIAQEVEKVIPEIVHDKKMPLIDDEVYKTIDYEKLVGVLIESVKELSAEVKELRSQINI
jgi:hypothetical protein